MDQVQAHVLDADGVTTVRFTRTGPGWFTNAEEFTLGSGALLRIVDEGRVYVGRVVVQPGRPSSVVLREEG